MRTSENSVYANFREYPKGEVRRIPLPRTPVNKGKKKGWGPRGPQPSIVKRPIAYPLPASAAHTAKPSARLSALKASGSPTGGASCEFMDTVAERLPLGLAAMNWV